MSSVIKFMWFEATDKYNYLKCVEALSYLLIRLWRDVLVFFQNSCSIYNYWFVHRK